MAIKYQEGFNIENYGRSMHETMLSATGKTIEEWIEIAKQCPETNHRARLKWMKEHHGLLQNRAMLVFSQLEGDSKLSWGEPKTLVAQLFEKYPEQYELYEQIALVIQTKWPEVKIAARKGYVPIYNKHQFAAFWPSKAGLVMALAVGAEESGLQPLKRHSASERLKVFALLDHINSFDEALQAQFVAAMQRS